MKALEITSLLNESFLIAWIICFDGAKVGRYAVVSK